MRIFAFALPLACLAAPAMAAPPPKPIEIPPQLTDPAMAGRLTDMLHVLSKSLLDLPAGEIQAAAEGRKPTAAERKMTVRDLGRRDDPNFDRNFERQMAEAGPMIEQSLSTLAKALPAMTESLSAAAEGMRQAVENMPRPMEPRP